MANFPQLNTGAAAQFPARRSLRFQNEIHRFVDGGEQRYRDSAGPLRRWELPFSQLREDEAAAFESFFQEAQGEAGSFEFHDPWDGASIAGCQVETGELETVGHDEGSVSTRLTIKENRD